MTLKFKVVTDPLQDQLHAFTRSITEIQWLTLVLVLLHLFISGTEPTSQFDLIAAMVVYGMFILAFSYSGFFRKDSEWKLAVETMGMIGFITVILWHTEGSESILVNLYLLAIISAALTLGKQMVMLELVLITACFMLLDFGAGVEVFSMQYAGRLLMQLGPVILVAYITTMLASDIHLAHEKIRKLAGKDELTGLMNLRGFTNIMQREHELAARYARQYTVAMLDVDNMKTINDRYGHEAGNNALKQLASILRANTRATDAAARFGGDEFVLLLVESSPEIAIEIIGRFRRQIADASIQVNGKKLPLEVSIGVANYPRDGTEPDDLLRAADMQMYEEKRRKLAAPADGGEIDPLPAATPKPDPEASDSAELS